MSNTRVLAIVLLLVLSLSLSLSRYVQTPLTDITFTVKESYRHLTESLLIRIKSHFNQAQTIQEQEIALKKCEKNALLAQKFAADINALYRELNATITLKPELVLTKAISYVTFGDISKVWIEFDDINSSKIYGLVANGAAAGIVVAKQGKAMALLNNNVKSTYAVAIGKSKAPGIVRGTGAQNMLVEYIPIFKEIKVGDEVTTSGLDRLFFPHIKVGRVLSISSAQGYQSAVVEPYFDATNPTYFHIITSVE